MFTQQEKLLIINYNIRECYRCSSWSGRERCVEFAVEFWILTKRVSHSNNACDWLKYILLYHKYKCFSSSISLTRINDVVAISFQSIWKTIFYILCIASGRFRHAYSQRLSSFLCAVVHNSFGLATNGVLSTYITTVRQHGISNQINA